MAGIIENIRKKSEAERKRITFLISITLTLIIFVAWLIVVFNTFTGGQESGQEEEIQRQGPFHSLIDNFSSGIREIGEQTKNLREISPF